MQTFLAEAAAVVVRRPFEPMDVLQQALGPHHLKVGCRDDPTAAQAVRTGKEV